MDVASLTALLSALGGLGPVMMSILIIGAIILAPVVLVIHLQHKFITSITGNVEHIFTDVTTRLSSINDTLKDIGEKLEIIPVISERLQHVEKKIDDIERHLENNEKNP